VLYRAGLALALAQDAARAKPLAVDLATRFPEATIVPFNYLPTIRAQLALDQADSSSAIKTLENATPYELGLPTGIVFSPALHPVYVRGQAYLAAHRGTEAATEFQKILDHRGVVVNEPIGALAHLGLARAYVLQGNTPKAKAAYQDFSPSGKTPTPTSPS
jgi:eukaryotic-like serine/threonine-protein kinase